VTRRVIAIPALALALAACGGSGQKPESTGADVFKDNGCVNCHTLKAAGATGHVGPDLDQLKPTEAAVVKQVTNGGGGMPKFGGSLSSAQIKAVAQYVSSNAGK
jgi:mono/diheme cytochrome c family protein